ncbi:MAG TPA: tRNA pseudouridine(38-40) synthase TruA [Spirochaetota bacterium]
MVSGDRTAGDPGIRRIALIVHYDGTSFNGWQVQPEGRCVQIELEKACSSICSHPVKSIVAGRTDAGVHALGQVVHFDTTSTIRLRRLCIGLNGILPSDVSVQNAFDVNPDFNARFDAVDREYVYLIYASPLRSPFYKTRALWITRELDIEYLRTASSFLIGEHDFSSFCKTSSAVDVNTVRTIHDIRWERRGSLIVFTIRGNAFLHNMVRSIVGTLLDMHKRELPPSFMSEILEKKDRRESGDTAAARGLYLSRVRYSPDLETFPSAFSYTEFTPGYFI